MPIATMQSNSTRFPRPDRRPLAGPAPPPAAQEAPSSSALDRLDEDLEKQLLPLPLVSPPTSSSCSQRSESSARADSLAEQSSGVAMTARVQQLERLLRAQEAELRKREGLMQQGSGGDGITDQVGREGNSLRFFGAL